MRNILLLLSLSLICFKVFAAELDYSISDECRSSEKYSFLPEMIPGNSWENIAQKECACMQKGGLFKKRVPSGWRRDYCVFYRLSAVEKHFSTGVLNYLHKENGPCQSFVNSLNGISDYKQINEQISAVCTANNTRKFLKRFLESPIDQKKASDQVLLLSMCGSELKSITTAVHGRDNNIDNEFGESAKKITSDCLSYMTNGTAATTARLRTKEQEAKEAKAKAKALAEQRKREEKLLADKLRKERIEKERIAAEELANKRAEERLAARESVFINAVPKERHRMVWGSEEAEKPVVRSSNSEIDTFQAINTIYQDAISEASGANLRFTPPKKGEFEKTDDYDKRVASLKHEYQVRIKEMRFVSEEKDVSYFQNAWYKVLGTPEILSLTYDADKERFQIQMGSSAWAGVQGYIVTPINVAPKVKEQLIKARPWIVFEKTSGKLVAVSAFLQSDSSIQEVMISRIVIPVEFTNKSKAAYSAAVEAERAQRNASYEAERARERASWPNGAIAKVSSRAFICVSMRSAIKAEAIRRANNPYITLPDDCANLNETKFALSVQHLNGGVAKVQLVGASASGFTSSSYIYE